MDWWALAAAVGLCIVMAGAEGILTGSSLPRWLASLDKPPLYAPMPVWVGVALLTYLIQGFIAYRLLAAPLSLAGIVALAFLVAVMAGNVVYNLVLARARSARVAYRGIIWFLPLPAALQMALYFVDPVSFWVGLAYVGWVTLYDLPIMRALAQLNPDRRRPG